MTKGITDAWWDYQKEKKEKETEEIWRRISLKLNSDLKPQIQEAQRTLSRINAKKAMPRSIIVKLQKIKDKEKKNPERSKKEVERRRQRLGWGRGRIGRKMKCSRIRWWWCSHNIVTVLTNTELNNFKQLKWQILFYVIKDQVTGFPAGSVVKNQYANAGDTGSIPGLGRSHT